MIGWRRERRRSRCTAIGRNVFVVSPGKRIAFVVALSAAVAASEGWAKSGAHGSRSGGARSGFHHHHFHRFVGGTVFLGAPFWGYYYPPYYYGPDYAARSEPPTVFVERFDGEPTPQTQGDIYCPSAGAYYPAVAQCAGGWQRVIRPEG